MCAFSYTPTRRARTDTADTNGVPPGRRRGPEGLHGAEYSTRRANSQNLGDKWRPGGVTNVQWIFDRVLQQTTLAVRAQEECIS